MIQLIVAVLLARVALAQVNPYADCCDQYCYRDDENPHLYFGTKTAYEFVYGRSSNQHMVPYCTPIQFWSFNRHGARLPSKKSIEVLENLQKIKEEIIKNYDLRGSYPDSGKLCDNDLEAFRRWNWNYSVNANSAQHLVDQGRDDITYLARRYQTRYPSLLGIRYSDEDFKFRHTDTERARSSYEAYINGLFRSEAFKVHAVSIYNDSLISAHKYCPSWQREVHDNPETISEYTRFKQHEEYKRLIAHVSRRLGFRYTLDENLVMSFYDMCRFEKAWYINKNSVWCGAFTKDQLKLLEYAEDLKEYYEAGYGTEQNRKLGCPPVKDMMNRFEKIVNGAQDQPKAVVYFSHSKPLELMLVALGINKDHRPLTADNMRQQNDRNWKTSKMNPFAANLASILYRCERDERYRVMFFLNENPVYYPGCSVGLCNWSYLKEHLSEAVENCDLEFCQRASAGRPTTVLGLIITALAFFYM